MDLAQIAPFAGLALPADAGGEPGPPLGVGVCHKGPLCRWYRPFLIVIHRHTAIFSIPYRIKIFSYQKIIFSYQKIFFPYQKIIFSYQKIFFPYRKIFFPYQKIIFSYQKMARPTAGRIGECRRHQVKTVRTILGDLGWL